MKHILFVCIFLLISINVSAQTDVPTTCEDGFRLIIHALGETCVPENPQRIVPLDMTITELLYLADMTPVALSETVLTSYERMHPDLADTFEAWREDSTVDMGFPPNIEAILSAEPDLIIGPLDLFSETLYPQLSEIAPTVLYEPAPGDWRTRLIFVGDVLGLDELVQTELDAYDTRVDELRDLLGEDAETITVSLVRVFPGQIGLVLAGTNAATILDSLGLSRPESQQYDYETVLDELDGRPELLISIEELFLADADVLFVFGDTSELFDNPLWNSLPAVIDGRAYEVGYYWWGDSLFSAHRMLDDVMLYIIE
ncbi:MAG: iron-siderophore ABC transporter substrate-binding protein [Anaerolineae bacterium]|jgi:iron complex transport system substrate-binding protein|nr:iron-siderophore ABC transporter substrate-binding protein [Anaerolineae bacterium]